MHIEHARIKNFRCIEDIAVDFEDLTAFIGPNNAGKSTILRALHWFFNGEPAALNDDDRHRGADPSDPIEVEVTFGGLTEEDRQAFGETFAPAEAEAVTVRRIWVDGKDRMAISLIGYPAFTELRSLQTGKKAAYAKLKAEQPGLKLPSATTGPQIEEALAAWETAHPDQLEAQYIEEKQLFGFNGKSPFSGLFDFVFVSADLRASEEAAEGRKTLLDQLVKRCIDFADAEAEAMANAASAVEAHKEIYQRHAGDRIKELEQAATDEIAGFLPGYEMRFDFRPELPRESRPNMEVLLDEAGGETPIHLQGHGAQRAGLMGLVKFFAAEIARIGFGGSMVFAIEEPELSQHRSQERVFARALRKIAADEANGVQVMYVTHSPNFIDPQAFQQVRRVVSEPGVIGGRRMVEVRGADPMAVESGSQIKLNSIRKTLGRMNPGDLSEAFFERAAVVVEGICEKAILRGITSRSGQRALDEDGIAIVAVNGKESLRAPHAVLGALGIPTLVIFDSDGAELGVDGKLTAPKEGKLKQNLALLEYMGLAEEEFKLGEIRSGLYALQDDLEQALERDWPKWEPTREAIAREGRGSREKKDFPTYEIAARECPTEPTGQLAEIVELARKLL